MIKIVPIKINTEFETPEGWLFKELVPISTQTEVKFHAVLVKKEKSSGIVKAPAGAIPNARA